MSEIYTTSRNQVSSVEALCLLTTYKNSKTTASEQSLQGERMEQDIDQKITHLKHQNMVYSKEHWSRCHTFVKA